MERILVAAWALFLSTPIDVQAAGADRGEVAQPSNGARAEAWDDLAQEFELAFAAWAMESMGPSPDAERAPSPALAFWPRFEVLAAAGEGRAVVWQIAQLRNFEEEREARAAILFERVRAAGTAPWVSMTYHHLVDAANGLAKDSLREYVAEQSLAAETQELRVALLLMRAALDDDPARSRELELQAAAMRWLDTDPDADQASAPEGDAEQLAQAVIEGVKHSKWFLENFFEGEDGIYFPRAIMGPDPKKVWRSSIEALAEQGSPSALVWYVTSSNPSTDSDRARFRTYLDALSRTELDPDAVAELAWHVDTWVDVLGSEFVEPKVRAIAANAEAEVEAQILAGLGDGICENAADDAARERGLAILRDVIERFPETPSGKSATGKVFRHTNLVVGKPVPDFEAVDVDGQAFKLSDYKGKVTVIDFWGFW